MSVAIVSEPVPLVVDSSGTVRVGGTRVTLDSVVAAYHEGFTAEEIAEQYPSVSLADIHATVAYYLRHREDLDRYLDERSAAAAELQRDIEQRFPSRTLRERLLARQQVP
jgi:uncharacterized protein (DUF433 family)